MKNGEHKGVMVEQHMNVLNDTELYIFKNGQMINLRLYIFYHNKKKILYIYSCNHKRMAHYATTG